MTWLQFIHQFSAGDNKSDLVTWWDHRYQAGEKPELSRKHDVLCVLNMEEKARLAGSDPLGPKVLFLTLDFRYLIKLQRAFRFILSPEQCHSFFLPYMFLNNAPLENSGSFPNKLLAVRLSSLLTERPLQAKEVARAFFEDPAMTTPEGLQQLPLRMQAYARGLNDERLNQLRNTVSVLPDEARDGAYEKIGQMLDSWEQQQAEELHAARIRVDSELASMKQALAVATERAEQAERLLQQNKAETKKIKGKEKFEKRHSRSSKPR